MSDSPFNTAPSGAAPRILLVEDEFLIRLTLAEVLTDEGYDVVEAATGDEAMALLETGLTVQILLTDIQLPGLLDGYALTKQARLAIPGLPVIFMTGRPDRADGPMADTLDTYIAKPYLPSDICKTVRRILG